MPAAWEVPIVAPPVAGQPARSQPSAADQRPVPVPEREPVTESGLEQPEAGTGQATERTITERTITERIATERTLTAPASAGQASAASGTRSWSQPGIGQPDLIHPRSGIEPGVIVQASQFGRTDQPSRSSQPDQTSQLTRNGLRKRMPRDQRMPPGATSGHRVIDLDAAARAEGRADRPAPVSSSPADVAARMSALRAGLQRGRQSEEAEEAGGGESAAKGSV